MEDINLEGCDICAENHDTLECPHLVANNDVEDEDPSALNLSRARLSLPHYLDYVECEDGTCQIVTKTTIKAKTKLGPFEARKTRQSLEIENAFILKIFLKDGTGLTLDTTDEEDCNWLCLVSAARSAEEQNCLVVQLGLDIYYMTMCNISPNTQLKVWYAPHYARKLGKSPQPDGMSIILLGCILSHQLAPVLMVQYDNTPHKFMQVEQAEESQGEENKVDGTGDLTVPNDKAPAFQCSQCDAFLPTEYALQLHEATHTGSSVGDMDVIQTALAMSESMVDSVNEIASPRVDKIQHSADDETHSCLRCPQTFKTMQELAVHVKEHLAEESPKRPRGRHKKLPLVIQPSEQASDKTTQTPTQASNKLKKYVALQRVKKERTTDDFEVESEVDVHNAAHIPHMPNKTIIRTRRQAAHEGEASTAIVIDDRVNNESSAEVLEEQNGSNASNNKDSTENDRTRASPTSNRKETYGKDDEALLQESTQSVKRGRGRPRKYQKVNDSATKQSENEKTNKETDNDEVCSIAESPASNEVTPIPRKRGRPRKRPLPPRKMPRLDDNEVTQVHSTDSNEIHGENEPATQNDSIDNNDKHGENEQSAGAVDNKDATDTSMIDLTNESTQIVDTNTDTSNVEIANKNDSSDSTHKSTDVIQDASEKGDLTAIQTESQTTNSDVLPENPDTALKVTSVKVREEQTKSKEMKPRAERLHRILQHCNMDVNPTGTMEYTCKECKASFLSLTEFEEHVKHHVGEYDCWQCKKTFKRMDLLCYHQCRAAASAKKVDVYTCKVCGKVFEKLKGLTRHMQGHLGKFSCDKCNKVFTRKDTFDRHACGSKPATDPSMVEKHVCEFCGASFNRRKYLLRHMAMHTGEFACKVCGREFARKESLMQHQLKCDPEIINQEGHSIFRCKLCNKVFAKEVSLQNHMMLHTEDHKCSICGKCFASHFSLLKHNCIGESEVIMEGENTTTVFNCTKCVKSFTKHLYLKRHMDMHNGQYSCIFCNESYARKDDLNKHLVDCTAMTQLIAKGRVECPACMEAFEDKEEFKIHYEIHTHPFMCEICQKRFIRKANLDTHECTPWNDDPVSCEVCSKQFLHPKFLQRHRVVHAEAKFKCLVCSKRFLSMEQLERHTELCPDAHKPKKRSWRTRERKVRSKPEDQYICPTCGKSYVSVSNLNKHILTHGEKKEECPFCHKMFHLKVNLKEHLRMVHTVEKKFECKYCGKKMKSRNSIYGHIRQFHQNTLFIYQCELCHRSFRQKGNLKKHVLMHSLEKYYSCSRCERKFKYVEQLKRHEKWHEYGYAHSCDHCNKKFVMKFELDRHIDTQHKGLMYICCYCQTECRHVHTMMRHLRRRHVDNFEWQQNIRQFCDGLRQHVGEGKKAVRKQPQSILPAVAQPKTLVPGPVTIQPQQSTTLDMTQLSELLQSSDGNTDQPYIIAEVCQLGQDDAMNTHTVIMCSGAVDTDSLQQQLQTALESLAQEGGSQENLSGTTMTIIGDISSADGQSVPVAYSESSLTENQGCFIIPMRKTDSAKPEHLQTNESTNPLDGNSLKSDAMTTLSNIISDNMIADHNVTETEDTAKITVETTLEEALTNDAQVAMDTDNSLHDNQVVARGDMHVIMDSSDQIVLEDTDNQVVVDGSHIVETDSIAMGDGDNQIVIDENNQIVLDGNNQVIMDNSNQIVVENNQVIFNGNQVILDNEQIVVSEDQPFSEVIPADSMNTIEQVVYGEYIV